MNTNTLPKITWRYLKANSGELEDLDLKYKEYCEDGKNISEKEFDEFFINSSYGVSKEVLDDNKRLRNHENFILVESGERIDRDYVYDLSDERNQLIDLQDIYLNENSKATLLYDIRSNDDVFAIRNSLIRIKADKNSELKIVLIQRLSSKSTSLLSIISEIEDGASVNLVQIELGSGQSLVNYVSNLRGKGASSYINTAYFVDGERNLDINYLINHIAREGVSNMSVNGALKDRAKKRFAGTLDFKKGSKLSNGNEEEYVTLLNQGVKNVAIPLLLAHEHDVQGNHAASAGRIDQDMLYYIMSRGLSKNEAKSIVVEAKFTPVLDLIDKEDLRGELKELLHKAIMN